MSWGLAGTAHGADSCWRDRLRAAVRGELADESEAEDLGRAEDAHEHAQGGGAGLAPEPDELFRRLLDDSDFLSPHATGRTKHAASLYRALSACHTAPRVSARTRQVAPSGARVRRLRAALAWLAWGWQQRCGRIVPPASRRSTSACRRERARGRRPRGAWVRARCPPAPLSMD